MRRRLFLALPAVVLSLSACSGGSGGSEGSGGATDDPTALLKAAAAKIATAKSVGFTLSSKGVPANSDGVTAAVGSGVIDAAEPKFKGTFTGRLAGLSGSIGLITIGDDTYTKFFDENYKPFDLATSGAPNPAAFFHPETGVGSLITKATELTVGGGVREGNDILREVKGKLPGAEVKRLFHLGDGTKAFDIAFGIAQSGELRKAVTTGEFFAGTTSTYTIVLKDYGVPVEITRP